MKKTLLSVLLLGLSGGVIFGWGNRQRPQTPAQGQPAAQQTQRQSSAQRSQTPAQGQPAAQQTQRQSSAQRSQTPAQGQPAAQQAQQQSSAQPPQMPAQGQPAAQQAQQQSSAQPPQTPAQGQPVAQQAQQQSSAQRPQTPAQGQPAAQRQSPAQQPSSTKTPVQTSTKPKAKTPEQAVLVLDVNPFMWIFSGIPDENNNRSIFFDIGVQYNMLPGIAVRFNPSFSFGFTSETAFTDSQMDFFELEFPFTFLCFPFPDETYLSPAFFGVSIICAYHDTVNPDSSNTVFFSIGAMMELGYQFKFSNHLAITPSIGISRIFPKPVDGTSSSVPNFNFYSPWTDDTPVAPRIRVTLGFWL